MFLCPTIGCSNRSDWDKGKGFFRLFAIITHQEDLTSELSELSEKRRQTSGSPRLIGKVWLVSKNSTKEYVLITSCAVCLPTL